MRKLFLLLIFLFAARGLGDVSIAAEHPNVLFIAIDDLRDLSAFPNAKMPGLDRLAAMGMKFSRAYCAAPVCNASRAALMSGLRPSMTGVYENNADGRNVIEPEMALPATFRKAGYFVAGAGKIDHEKFNQRELWDAWQKNDGKNPAPKEQVVAANFLRSPLDCEDSEMRDYRIAQYGIDFLTQKNVKQPFFLAIGLHNPHSPWNVPRKYYDQYPLESIALPPYLQGDLDDLPVAGQHMAKWAGTLLPKPDGDHAAIIGRNQWKQAIQGYLAACTFADAQVGRILDAYEQSENRDNTIICLWSDHGWHLGEKDHWRKFSLWEEGTRSPLYWVAPGITQPGSICETPVDFMSIYPTLTALCGIVTPKHVEGPNITPLLTDPNVAWTKPAITTYLQNNHTIRVRNWRYIRYADGGEELYDSIADPHEWKNLASNPSYLQTKLELTKLLPTINHDDIGIPKEPKKKAKSTK